MRKCVPPVAGTATPTGGAVSNAPTAAAAASR